MQAALGSFGWALGLLLVASASQVRIDTTRLEKSTPRTFLAHGWEPWTATTSFDLFDNPVFLKAMSHLGGQTVRFGGISADWLKYVITDEVTPPCRFGQRHPFTESGQCPFSTGALNKLLKFLQDANIRVLFDLNELLGRNCSQKGQKPWQPDEWCGDKPAKWDTKPIKSLLEYIRDHKLKFCGFELGNELFAPPHISHETANKDIWAAGQLLRATFNDSAPILYASGTNDCANNNNSDTMSALLQTRKSEGVKTGFSFHSYPGDVRSWWNKTDLTSYLLNASWLRTALLAQTAPCIAAWNEGPRAEGLTVAVTEAAAMSGQLPKGLPSTNSHIHGFFSIAQLGQFANVGASVLARWGIPGLLGSNLGMSAGSWSVDNVASDFFLYALFNATVGHGVLSVSGGDTGEVLVYAHCAATHNYGANGSVTVFAANPSSSEQKLQVSLPSLPRLDYVLTAPNNDLASRTPVLNGNTEAPLKLKEDGSLPEMEGRFCSPGQDGCTEELLLPPLSQGFFVLLGSGAIACEQ